MSAEVRARFVADSEYARAARSMSSTFDRCESNRRAVSEGRGVGKRGDLGFRGQPACEAVSGRLRTALGNDGPILAWLPRPPAAIVFTAFFLLPLGNLFLIGGSGARGGARTQRC